MSLLKQLSIVLPALALTLMNTACSMETVSSKDVKSEAVYQNYSLHYDEVQNSTSLSAQFRVGGFSGTTVRLDEPAALKINGKNLEKSWFFGTRYELRAPGFVPSATFEYQDANGQTMMNSISISPIFLRNAPSMASVAHPYEVDVEAVNWTDGEDLRVSLTQTLRDPQSNGSRLLSAEATYDRARSKAVFSAASLKALNNGPAILKITRTKHGAMAQTTREGGSISASYSLREVSVTIVKN